jgi:hypothetical protein
MKKQKIDFIEENIAESRSEDTEIQLKGAITNFIIHFIKGKEFQRILKTLFLMVFILFAHYLTIYFFAVSNEQKMEDFHSIFIRIEGILIGILGWFLGSKSK